MNITCQISSINESNPFNSSACNNTGEDNDYEIALMVNILTILLSFPINSYVIWLIVMGTGNGLAAEFFTSLVCEIFNSIECIFVSLIYTHYMSESAWGVMYFLDGIPITGRPLFQCLICVERYLAVVHPVIFLKFKPLRYRLMCSAVVWIICFCSCIFNCMLWLFWHLHLYYILYLAQLLFFFSIQLFCCVAVLRALKQSGPGERGREREEENHMKKRAFHLILITAVTTGILITPQVTLMPVGWSSKDRNILLPVSYIFFPFAGLVQPLLFLYRTSSK